MWKVTHAITPEAFALPRRGAIFCILSLGLLVFAAGCEQDEGRLRPTERPTGSAAGNRGGRTTGAPATGVVASPSETGLAVIPPGGAPENGNASRGPAGLAAETDSVDRWASCTYEEAESLYRQRDFAEAQGAFASWVVRHPENAWGRYMLGLSAWKAGDLVTAERELRTLLESSPGHHKARVNLTRVLLAGGRYEEAREMIAPALDSHPEDPDAHRVAGRTCHNLGLVGDAEDEYRLVLQLTPRDPWALNNLGLLLLQQGRYEDALGPLALAVRERGEVALFHNNLGAVLERLGDTEGAAAAYRAAVELNPEHTAAAASLARVEPICSRRIVDLADVAERFTRALSASSVPGTETEAGPAAGETVAPPSDDLGAIGP